MKNITAPVVIGALLLVFTAATGCVLEDPQLSSEASLESSRTLGVIRVAPEGSACRVSDTDPWHPAYENTPLLDGYSFKNFYDNAMTVDILDRAQVRFIEATAENPATLTILDAENAQVMTPEGAWKAATPGEQDVLGLRTGEDGWLRALNCPVAEIEQLSML